MNIVYTDKMRDYLAKQGKSDVLIYAFRPKG